MKLALAIAGGLAIAMADQVPTQAPVNSTSHGGSSTIQCALFPPNAGGLYNWYYNSRAEGPYVCTANHDSKPWAMLSAYRSGGTQGVHWKYTDDPADPECITSWTYYGSDGNSVIESSVRRTTSSGDTRRWCALPVYRSGGVIGKQWNYCVLGCL